MKKPSSALARWSLVVVSITAFILSSLAGLFVLAGVTLLLAVIAAGFACIERREEASRRTAQRAPFTTVERGKSRE